MSMPDPEIVPLFATPIIRLDVPDAAQLTADLRRVIEEREKVQESTHHSNQGGWQSTWDMDRWGGAPAIKLLAHARNLANRVTTDRKGNIGNGPHPGYFAVTWHGNMWANINRSGHANEFHSHPGAYWSCVYYVDDGGIGEDPALGGAHARAHAPVHPGARALRAALRRPPRCRRRSPAGCPRRRTTPSRRHPGSR